MQRVLVIYDATGKIWNTVYGEEEIPPGVPSIFVEVPEGATLERIDTSNPSRPEPVFVYNSEGINLQEEVKTLKAIVDDIALSVAKMIGGAS